MRQSLANRISVVHRPWRKPVYSYGFAVLLQMLALLLTWLSLPLLRGAVFLFFYPAVLLSALYGGLGPGLLATFVAVVAVNYFFLPPLLTLQIDSGEIMRLMVFALMAFLISWLTEARRQAEVHAHAQRAQWELTLASIGDGVIVTDMQGRVTFMNAVAEKLTGWSRETARDQDVAGVFRICNEYTREPVTSPIDHVLRAGTVAGLANHTLLIARDGTEHPIDDCAAPVHDAGGALVGTVLVFRDISERRQAETNMRTSEERYRCLVTATSSIVWVTDATGAFVTPQPTWEEYTGQQWPAYQGWGWLDQLHPEDRARVHETWLSVVREQTAYEVRGRIWHAASATYRHFVARGVALVNEDGTTREWIGTIVDIEEHWRTREAARETAERLQVALRAAGMVAWEWNLATDIVGRSQTAVEVLGIHPDETIQSAHHEFGLIHSDDRARHQAIIAEAMQHCGEYVVQFRFIRPDNQAQIWLESRGRVICDEQGQAQRLSGMVMDITTRKHAEQERADLLAREQAARTVAEDAQRRFASLADASHAFTGARLDRQAILEQLSRIVSTVIGDLCTVRLLSDDGQWLQAAAIQHSDPELLPLLSAVTDVPGQAGQGFAGRVIQSGQPLRLETVSPEELRTQIGPELWPSLERLGVTSLLMVPMREQGRVIGVVSCARTRSGAPYTADDQVFLQDLADRAALAVDNAQLYTAEQQVRLAAERTAERIARLQTVTAALAEALTPDQVMRIVIEQGMAALHAVAGVVVTVTDDGTALVTAHAVGFAEETLEQWQRFPLDAPAPLAEAVRTMQPVWLASEEERARRYPNLAQYRNEQRAWASLPLISEGRVVGGLGWSFATPHVFAPDDQAFLLTLAQQCAQALEHARSIEALRRSEERFRVTQELSLYAFAIFRSVRDDQGTIVDFVWEYANPAAAQLLHRPVEELLGRRLLEMMPQHRDTGLFERYLRVAETGEPHDVELYYSGEGINGWFRNMTVKLEDGVAVSFRDITARKQTEEALRFLIEASNQLTSSLDYDLTLQNVAHLVVPHLADFCVIDLLEQPPALNRVAVAHVDTDREALLQVAALPYAVHANETHPVWQVLRSGQSLHIPDVTYQPDAYARANDPFAPVETFGQYHALLLVPLVARNRTVGVISFGLIHAERRFHARDMALAEDLARRAALAIDNARLYRETQAAIRMRDQFLSIASHELRNPLTVLLGQSQLLQRRVERTSSFGERDRRAIQMITDQATRLNTMIGTMLDVSRMESGQLQIARAPLDLCALVHQMVEGFQPMLDQHTIECTTPDEPLMISGDAVRLQQVVQNLVGNALKYSPEGGIVSVQVEQRGDRACVSITDEGIGIPAEALPQLFQPFYRVSKTGGRPVSGMGIGLYVVKEIVALHDGEVTVASHEGLGSTFTIYLPM